MLLQHLELRRFTLNPGETWEPDPESHLLFMLTDGAGYWLSKDSTVALERGQTLFQANSQADSFLCSQIGKCRIAVVALGSLRIGQLSGRIDHSKTSWRRVFDASHTVSTGFSKIVSRNPSAVLSLLVRAETVRLLIEAIDSSSNASRPKGRPLSVHKFIEILIDSDLPKSRLSAYASLCGCTPRHLRRIYLHAFKGNSQPTFPGPDPSAASPSCHETDKRRSSRETRMSAS